MRWLASAALAVALAVAPGANVQAADPSVASPSDDSGRPDFHSLTIVILDGQTEEQISARCSVVDAGGQPAYAIPAAGCFYHAPCGDSPAYFYSRGQSVLFVPAGPTEVTVARGFEYGTVVYTVEPDDALFMAEAEGLNVINCLDIQYFFTGGPDSCSTSDCIVYMGEEYRSSVYGHSSLLGLSSLVMPPSTRWWPLLMDVADEVHTQPGAAIICAHPATTNDFYDIETVSRKSLRTKEMWYRILNCGFRLPACSGTDAGLSAAYGKPPGSCRVYVLIDGEFNYDSWLSNLVAGRTFVTNGPLFTELDVGDFALGDSVDLTTQGVAYVDGHVRVECETPLRRVDVLCNGQIRQTFFLAVRSISILPRSAGIAGLGGPAGAFLTGRTGCGIMNVESHSFTLTDTGEVA